jgi:Flp pilus assembly protein TadD/4-amino-4-deoxy-L-arabinose transferase-like glycosyltransferase
LQALWVVGVLGLGLLIRVGYLAMASERLATFSVPIIDGDYYDQWATRVAGGQGYGASPFYLAPLYPYCVAAVYSVLGHDYALVYAVQAGLGLVNLLLVYLLARWIAGQHKAGLAAMCLMLLYAPVLMLEGKLLSETLGLTLTLAALLTLFRSIERRSVIRGLVAGLVLGLSILCRSNNLLFAMLLGGWLLYRAARGHDSSWLRPVLGIMVGVVLAIAPVTIRNVVVGHDWVLIQSNLGMTFAQGNNENARGLVSHPPGTSAGIASQQAEEMSIAQRELGRAVKPSESSSYWLSRSLRYLREHPRFAMGLLGRKLVYAFNNREEQDSFETAYEVARVPLLRLLFVPFSVLAGLAIIGGISTRRSAPAKVQLLALYVLTVFAAMIVFYVSSRYRVLCVPALAVLAGPGLLELVRVFREGTRSQVALLLGVLAATTALGQVPYPMSRSTGAFTYLNVSERLQAANRPEAAAKALLEGVKTCPSAMELHGELGLLLSRMGHPREAVQYYESAVKSFPEVVQLRLNAAAAYNQLHSYGEAEEHWARALQLNPDCLQAYVNRGASRFARGLVDEAIADFNEAIRRDPAQPLAQNGLGVALLRSNRLAEGIEHLQKAVELDPRYPQARHNLAMALAEAGRIDEAIAQFQQLIRMNPRNPQLASQYEALLRRQSSTSPQTAPAGR